MAHVMEYALIVEFRYLLCRDEIDSFKSDPNCRLHFAHTTEDSDSACHHLVFSYVDEEALMDQRRSILIQHKENTMNVRFERIVGFDASVEFWFKYFREFLPYLTAVYMYRLVSGVADWVLCDVYPRLKSLVTVEMEFISLPGPEAVPALDLLDTTITFNSPLCEKIMLLKPNIQFTFQTDAPLTDDDAKEMTDTLTVMYYTFAKWRIEWPDKRVDMIHTCVFPLCEAISLPFFQSLSASTLVYLHLSISQGFPLSIAKICLNGFTHVKRLYVDIVSCEAEYLDVLSTLVQQGFQALTRIYVDVHGQQPILKRMVHAVFTRKTCSRQRLRLQINVSDELAEPVKMKEILPYRTLLNIPVENPEVLFEKCSVYETTREYVLEMRRLFTEILYVRETEPCTILYSMPIELVQHLYGFIVA